MFFSKYKFAYLFLLVTVISISCIKVNGQSKIHVWEMKEIKLTSEKNYHNYYTDVTCWVELKGPDFSKRIYGFWDGGHNFIVRVTATKSGDWHWVSGSDQPDDNGLNNKSGSFTAVQDMLP